MSAAESFPKRIVHGADRAAVIGKDNSDCRNLAAVCLVLHCPVNQTPGPNLCGGSGSGRCLGPLLFHTSFFCFLLDRRAATRQGENVESCAQIFAPGIAPLPPPSLWVEVMWFRLMVPPHLVDRQPPDVCSTVQLCSWYHPIHN